MQISSYRIAERLRNRTQWYKQILFSKRHILAFKRLFHAQVGRGRPNLICIYLRDMIMQASVRIYTYIHIYIYMIVLKNFNFVRFSWNLCVAIGTCNGEHEYISFIHMKCQEHKNGCDSEVAARIATQKRRLYFSNVCYCIQVPFINS